MESIQPPSVATTTVPMGSAACWRTLVTNGRFNPGVRSSA
jgi:hypothetical protein